MNRPNFRSYTMVNYIKQINFHLATNIPHVKGILFGEIYLTLSWQAPTHSSDKTMGARDVALPHGWHRQSRLLLLSLLFLLLLSCSSVPLPHFRPAKNPPCLETCLSECGCNSKIDRRAANEVAEEKGKIGKGKCRRGREVGGGLQVYRRESIQIQAICLCVRIGIP